MEVDLLAETDPVTFVRKLGTNDINHTSGPNFFNHLHGVMKVLEDWGVDKDMQLAGLFHSIYGTEGFQGFTLSLDNRPAVQRLIGERAEFICWLNCVMDRASLDATLSHPSGNHHIFTRPEYGGARVDLTDEHFQLLILLHLADWLEAVERCASMCDERHQWGVGEAWGYRRGAYQRMADILGGPALRCYQATFAREPEASRHFHQDSTPSFKWPEQKRNDVRIPVV